MGSHIPHNHMTVGPSSKNLLSSANKSSSESSCVADNLLTIGFELWRGNFFHLGRERTNLNIVRSTLQCWEDGKVYSVFELFATENDARPWSSQSFVSCWRNNVTMRERVIHNLTRNQSTIMRNISH